MYVLLCLQNLQVNVVQLYTLCPSCSHSPNLKHEWHVLFCFLFQNKTPSISYKILQLTMLYTNTIREAIVPSYVEAHRLKKGRGRPLLDEG